MRRPIGNLGLILSFVVSEIWRLRDEPYVVKLESSGYPSFCDPSLRSDTIPERVTHRQAAILTNNNSYLTALV